MRVCVRVCVRARACASAGACVFQATATRFQADSYSQIRLVGVLSNRYSTHQCHGVVKYAFGSSSG